MSRSAIWMSALGVLLLCSGRGSAAENAPKKPSIADVAQAMDESASGLQSGNAGPETQAAQERAIALLEALIRQQSGKSKSGTSQGKQPGQSGQKPSDEPEDDKPSAAGESPAGAKPDKDDQESEEDKMAGSGQPAQTSGTPEDGPPPGRLDERDPSGDGAWGALPDRERQAALNTIGETCGNQYRDLVESYCRSFSEETTP